uniref:F-box domain-containing protein n=1 Tax=Mycena chlorophos TaxID=658473 RepID=A0ABQ0LKC7_MYCCL|nr:predicted protein [Mycena chlorophos]
MTQTPNPPPELNTWNGFESASPGPGVQCGPLRIIALQPFGWDPNLRREELIKIDVERRCIIRPGSGDSAIWGIFYSPEDGRAKFFPKPARKVVPPVVPRQNRTRLHIRSMRGIYERDEIVDWPTLPPAEEAQEYSMDLEDQPQPEAASVHSSVGSQLEMEGRLTHLVSVPVPRRSVMSITNLQRSDIDADLATMEQKRDLWGLHYILMAPNNLTDIVERLCLRLLLDTACPVTYVKCVPTKNHTHSSPGSWVFIPETKKLLEKIVASQSSSDQSESTEHATTKKFKYSTSKPPTLVERYPGAQSYSGTGAIQLTTGVAQIKFADQQVVWLKLWKGLLRLVNGGSSGSRALDPIVEFPDFKFATCEAATTERTTEQIDGMLGLSHKPWAFGHTGIHSSDLFVPRVSRAAGIRGRGEPIFTLALGDDYGEIPGWFIIDAEGQDSDVLPQNTVRHRTWSPWMKTIETNLVQWIIKLVGLSIGYAKGPPMDMSKTPPPPAYAFMLDTGSLYTYVPDAFFNLLLKWLPHGRTTPLGEPCCRVDRESPEWERLKRKVVTMHLDDGTSIELGSLDMFIMPHGPNLQREPNEWYCSFRRGAMDTRSIDDTAESSSRQRQSRDPPELYIFGNLFLRAREWPNINRADLCDPVAREPKARRSVFFRPSRTNCYRTQKLSALSTLASARTCREVCGPDPTGDKPHEPPTRSRYTTIRTWAGCAETTSCMPRIVVREPMGSESPMSTPIGKSLSSLSNELLLVIFQSLDNEDTTSVSSCCRRFRALLLPAVFRSIRWPASQQEFPPSNLWSHISLLRLSENELEHYSADMRLTVASQIRDALPRMVHLKAFLLDKTIGGGMWPELLDAFSALAAPCKLLINSGWYLSDDDMFVLPPRVTELRFSAFDYPFPFAYKEKEDCVTRRTMEIWQAEVYNVRGIIQATSKTMNTLQLPGELLRAMEGTTWTALTHLVLYGLWPTRANDTSDYTFVERRRPTPPSRLPESPSESVFSTTLEIVDDSVEAQDPPIHTTEEREPSVSNSAPQSSPAPEPTVMSPSVLHTPEIPPRPEESVSEPAAEIEGKEHSEFALLEDAPSAPARGPSPPAASLPASETFPGLDERVVERETLQRETTPVVETMTAPGLSSTAAPPAFEPVSSSGSPSEQPTDAVVPGPSTLNQPQNPPPSPPAIPNRSPLLVILESMPHLRVLTIQLLIQEEDERPLGGLICSSDERSIPVSPTSFLRHLTRFEATCLAEEDRLVDYLPNTLVSLAIPRYPYMLEEGMARLELTPASVLSKLKNASFPRLRTLRLWYGIHNAADLESEKELHDFLPSKFPHLQNFELCRRWLHNRESLKDLWDPLPVICKLVYRLKALRTLRFDPHLPGLAEHVPFTYRNDRYFAMIGRLHVMASAIVNEAPWIKRIQMFSEFGLNPDLFWETWSVVPDGEGRVKLDRPIPPVVYG